ncbi:MAG: hypothetical protein IT424_15175 [Pirellulales bacterium]|nr:hypothetical protein [Pirellulales bacterium]
MHDQADQLRQLVRATLAADAALQPGAPIVTLSGSQAGAGATAAACCLARELARLGRQVILIDAAIALQHSSAAATALLARRRPRPRATLADVLAGGRRAVEALALTHDDGLRLLAGCPAEAAPPLDRRAVERFSAELAALSREADVLIIDAGHGMNAWIDRLWQLARQVLLVTTPDDPSFLEAYAVVKLAQHEQLEGKLRLVLNRAADGDLATLGRRFAETCQRFLSLTPHSAAALPAWQRNGAGSADGSFVRAVRLLAADVACDFRVSSLRLLRPRPRSHASASQRVR